MTVVKDTSKAVSFSINGAYRVYYITSNTVLLYDKNGVDDTTNAPSGVEWATTFSNSPDDCSSLMDFQTDSTPSNADLTAAADQFQTITGVDAYTVGSNPPDPTHTITTVAFESGYHYKVYRQLINGSSQLGMISSPWFQCAKSEIVFEANIERSNYYADAENSQEVKFASIDTNKSSQGHICRDKKILPGLSYFTATYETLSRSGNLDLGYARQVRSENDCSSLGISDAGECSAYHIFNRLLRIKNISNSQLQEFSVEVPGCEKHSYRNLKVKLSTVTFMWETDLKTSPMEWTIIFCQSDPSLNTNNTVVATSQDTETSKFVITQVATDKEDSTESKDETQSETTEATSESLLN